MSSTEIRLKEIVVHPGQLYLDPNNPRIRCVRHGQKRLSPKDALNEDLQKGLLADIEKGTHDLNALMESISSSGYLNIDSIFVQEIEPEKYLVLEGNRRTTAVKILTGNSGSLSESVRRSLQKIPVKVLLENDAERARQAVSRILAIRHINGPKPWGAMLEAFHIFDEYRNEMGSSLSSSSFVYDEDTARVVARNVNRREPSIRRAIAIVRIFQHLQERGIEVSTASYSLLKMSLDAESLRETYFQIDDANFLPSEIGVERYQSLMFSDGAPILNPGAFRAFKKVYDYSDGAGVDLVVDIESRSISPSDATGILDRRMNSRAFEAQLGNVLADLKAIPIDSFRGVESEIQLVNRLIEVVMKIGRVACSPSVAALEDLERQFGKK